MAVYAPPGPAVPVSRLPAHRGERRNTIKSEITDEFGLEYEFIKYLFLDKNPKGERFIKVDMIEYGFSKY